MMFKFQQMKVQFDISYRMALGKRCHSVFCNKNISVFCSISSKQRVVTDRNNQALGGKLKSVLEHFPLYLTA